MRWWLKAHGHIKEVILDREAAAPLTAHADSELLSRVERVFSGIKTTAKSLIPPWSLQNFDSSKWPIRNVRGSAGCAFFAEADRLAVKSFRLSLHPYTRLELPVRSHATAVQGRFSSRFDCNQDGLTQGDGLPVRARMEAPAAMPVQSSRTLATLSLYSSLGSNPSMILMPATRLEPSSQICALSGSILRSASFGSSLPPSYQAAT